MPIRSLVFCALLVTACDDDVIVSSDLAVATDDLAETTCSQLCQHFAVCFEAANPNFMGSNMALVPCENTCFSLTEQGRDDLRTCDTQGCAAFLVCAENAGLKLMPKPIMDMAAHD